MLLAETGQTYDEANIRDWLQSHSTCPASGKQLRSIPQLIPNYTLQQSIQHWAEKHGMQLPPLAACSTLTMGCASVAPSSSRDSISVCNSNSPYVGLQEVSSTCMTAGNDCCGAPSCREQALIPWAMGDLLSSSSGSMDVGVSRSCVEQSSHLDQGCRAYLQSSGMASSPAATGDQGQQTGASCMGPRLDWQPQDPMGSYTSSQTACMGLAEPVTADRGCASSACATGSERWPYKSFDSLTPLPEVAEATEPPSARGSHGLCQGNVRPPRETASFGIPAAFVPRPALTFKRHPCWYAMGLIALVLLVGAGVAVGLHFILQQRVHAAAALAETAVTIVSSIPARTSQGEVPAQLEITAAASPRRILPFKTGAVTLAATDASPATAALAASARRESKARRTEERLDTLPAAAAEGDHVLGGSMVRETTTVAATRGSSPSLRGHAAALSTTGPSSGTMPVPAGAVPSGQTSWDIAHKASAETSKLADVHCKPKGMLVLGYIVCYGIKHMVPLILSYGKILYICVHW